MSDTANQDKQRLLELLSDRALFGLEANEEQELRDLQKTYPEVDDQEMDRVVALLEAASPNADRIPSSVKQQIRMATDSNVSTPSSPTPKSNSWITPREVAIGLLTAAVTALFAMWMWNMAPGELPLQARRQELMEKAADLVEVAWTSTDETKSYAGDVVWSTDQQSGFMTFNGLPANDPSKEQYQLWIFDRNQDERHPIDGGVFNVVANDAGECVVEIASKLAVVDPTMFAITIEKPGGVVVSDRSRLPLLAQLN